MKLAIEKVIKEVLNKENLSKQFWHCVEYFDRKNPKTKL
jgi:hypothetical protein